MRRRFIPHWNDWRLILGVALAAAVIGLTLPMIQRFRTSEAQAAMLATPAPIDGQRAYGYLKKICEFGPRIAGTEANTLQRKMVAEHFTKAGGKVREQPFQARHPLTGRRVDMVNLIASWQPERLHRVVICADYDTRPRPDQEDDPARLNQPFIGANDCASGVALLMEIANHLGKLETQWGVDLVLLDGEELVYGNDPGGGEYFLGSQAFARAYAAQFERARPRMQYEAGLLLDMVGGRDMQIKREPYSLEYAGDVVRDVWAVARQLDAKSFSNEVGRAVKDDHLALNNGGIHTIDLIDFDYPYWHKVDDVPKNCSAESLAEVGRVVTGWLSQSRRRTRR